MFSQKVLNKLDFLKNNKKLERVLLIGGNGQVGQSLQEPLKYIYGESNLLITDLEKKNDYKNFVKLDAMDKIEMLKIFEDFKPDLVLHLVALLSGMYCLIY